MTKTQIKQNINGVKMHIAWCQAKWEELLQPSPLGFTVNNYHNWSLEKLAYTVGIQDQERRYKNKLWKLRWQLLVCVLKEKIYG